MLAELLAPQRTAPLYPVCPQASCAPASMPSALRILPLLLIIAAQGKYFHQRRNHIITEFCDERKLNLALSSSPRPARLLPLQGSPKTLKMATEHMKQILKGWLAVQHQPLQYVSI